MRNLTATLCLTLVVLLFSPTEGWSADFQKGLDAARSGDFATALREWAPLAKQGNASAQNGLGALYQHGQGVPQDNKTAVKWYRLAAEQGYASAQYNLGVMYRKGEGVPQDNKTAVKWYRLAAEQGLAPAQYIVGWMYAKGLGVPQDNKAALKWFSLAAEQGHSTAQKVVPMVRKVIKEQLETKTSKTRQVASNQPAQKTSATETKCNEIRGSRYPAKIPVSSSMQLVKLNHGDYSNRGNEAYQMGDPAAALCWWKPLAMAQQSSDIAVRATHNVGVLYKEGYGVTKDHKIAMRFFRQAAEKHYSISQYELGELYEKGEGIVVDLMESAKWYRLAARKGGPADVNSKEKYAALALKALKQPKFSKAAAKTKVVELHKELSDYYIVYITVRECNKVSSQYISNSQIETAKSKIRSFQDYYEGKYKNMDTAAVWESAAADWDEKFGKSFALFAALGVYSEELNGICRLQFLSFSTANVPGAEEQKRKRDF